MSSGDRLHPDRPRHDAVTTVTVYYRDSLIGTLTRESDGFWFRYSQEFREHPCVLPLWGFRDPHRDYHSKRLWPFFSTRIPPLGREDVQQALRHQNIDPTDTLQVLGKLCRFCVTNPFRLELRYLEH